MSFKVICPGGYTVEDMYNDNIDVNIILPDERIFFATFFTIINIQDLMQKDELKEYFWATDMVIVKDLGKETLRKAISKIIEEGYTETIFCKIGTVKTNYSETMFYEDLKDDLLE